MNRNIALVAAVILVSASPVNAEPIDELRKKATSNDPQAQFLLGEAYRTGGTVVADRDMAIAWFRRSAAQGNERAADMLGQLLFTKGQWQEAVPLLESAARRGDPNALYLLGTAHVNGDGVMKDLPRAYAEMRAAAKQGLPQAISSFRIMESFVSDADKAKALAIHVFPEL